MQQLKEKEKASKTKKPAGGFAGMSITQADIGASPQMQKGGVFTRKDKPNSPLAMADKFKLGKRNKK